MAEKNEINSVSKKKIPTKRVYICSPFRGDIRLNKIKARLYCRFAFESGFVPIAPHLFYTQFLDDNSKYERSAGLRYGLETMWQASEVWVFGDNFPEGMKIEINLAEEIGIPIRYFDSRMEEIDA